MIGQDSEDKRPNLMPQRARQPEAPETSERLRNRFYQIQRRCKAPLHLRHVYETLLTI